MDYEPDIRLQIKVRNARILRAMNKAGIYSVAELCRRAGVKYQLVVGIVAFKKAPIIRKTGEWKNSAMAVATALHVMPDELWPEYLQRIEAAKTEINLDITAEQFGAIASGEANILDHDRVKQFMRDLTPRHRKVIEMRFGLNGNGVHTFDEVGEEMGVSKERVRQMELKALTHMRRQVATRALS